MVDGGGSQSVTLPSGSVTALEVKSASACAASWADSKVMTAYWQASSERMDLNAMWRGILLTFFRISLPMDVSDMEREQTTDSAQLLDAAREWSLVRGGLGRKSVTTDPLLGLRSLFFNESPVLLERDVCNAVSSSLRALTLPSMLVGVDSSRTGGSVVGNGDCDGRPVAQRGKVAPCAALA